MKKETIAALFLASLALGGAWNNLHLKKILEQTSYHITCSADACQEENFSVALTELDNAFSIWNKNEVYTNTFIPQDAVDAVTNAYYNVCNALRCYDRLEAVTAYESLKNQLQSILSAESPSLHSIF